MQDSNEMKEYIRPSYFYLFASAGILLIGIMGAFAAKSIGVFIFLGVIAVLNSISTITGLSHFNEIIRQATENGSIDQIVREFQSATPFADGALRLGSRHVFGKRSGNILEYGDITKVYQYIHKTNFAEDRRELRVETKDSKVISLCKLSLRGKSDETLMVILRVMLSHNPAIKIGYK